MVPHICPGLPPALTDVWSPICPKVMTRRGCNASATPLQRAPPMVSLAMKVRLKEHEMSKNGTLAVAALATAILMLDIAVVNTALGHIADDLNAGLSGLQWVVDAYTLALASVVLTAGSIADRLGRRRVFVTGIVVFTI